jgi:hypothetical protein
MVASLIATVARFAADQAGGLRYGIGPEADWLPQQIGHPICRDPSDNAETECKGSALPAVRKIPHSGFFISLIARSEQYKGRIGGACTVSDSQSCSARNDFPQIQYVISQIEKVPRHGHRL